MPYCEPTLLAGLRGSASALLMQNSKTVSQFTVVNSHPKNLSRARSMHKAVQAVKLGVLLALTALLLFTYFTSDAYTFGDTFRLVSLFGCVM
jgi:hypothetical protein